jgi:hypothetical protein
MRSIPRQHRASRWLTWTLPPLALLLLAACETAPVECPPPEKVPVPVREPIKPELISDCVLPTTLPQEGPLRFRDVDEYTLSVETALACARLKLKALRDLEATR